MKNVLFLLLAVMCCFAGGCNEPTVCDCSDEIDEFIEMVKSSTDSAPPLNSSSCAQCGADCLVLEIECVQTCVDDAYELFMSCIDDCHDDFTRCLDGCD